LSLQLFGCNSKPVQQEKPKNFLQWCQEKESSPADIKGTIDFLLNKAGSKNCQVANTKLTNLTQLEVWSDTRFFSEDNAFNIKLLSSFTKLKKLDAKQTRASDITPLHNLINLEELNLFYSNNIVDLKPLSGLVNLQKLYLHTGDGDGKLRDISPLTNLINLKELTLSGNKISDLSPLSNLSKLTYLTLNSNKISAVKPLSDLIDLQHLTLGDNEISDVKPLINLSNLRMLALDSTKIVDVEPLSRLSKLVHLNLNYNRIIDVQPLSNLSKLKKLELVPDNGFLGIGASGIRHECPVKPVSVCTLSRQVNIY
jgi:internalin A